MDMAGYPRRDHIDSVGTLALTWPPLGRPCEGYHPGIGPCPPAVVAGSTSGVGGEDVAYCLSCAAAYHADFEPSCRGRVVPTLAELTLAQDLRAARTAPTPLPAEDAAFAHATGLPRPLAKVHLPAPTDDDRDATVTRRLPAPWINGHHTAGGDFYSFRDDALTAFEDQLCCICGEDLETVVAIAAANGKRHTSGGWGHPRCVLLAVATCPHFTNGNFDTVAYAWDGAGVGCPRVELNDRDPIEESATALSLAELRAWARSDPHGTQPLPWVATSTGTAAVTSEDTAVGEVGAGGVDGIEVTADVPAVPEPAYV